MFGGNWEYRITFTHKALKQLKALDKNTQAKIKVAVEKLRWVPPQGDIKKLKAVDGVVYILREGNWRVLFEYAHGERTVIITGIYHRKEVYQ